MAKLFNIGGEVFGMWRVIERGPLATRGEYAKWWCLCICGAFKLVPGKALRCGQSRSCGCTRSYEHNAYPHGDVREFIARFNSYKEKAERRGIAFALTLEQFADIARRDCTYCGRPPHLPVRRARAQIDAIDERCRSRRQRTRLLHGQCRSLLHCVQRNEARPKR